MIHVQNGECGDAGDFTHLTPWFVVNHDGDAQDILGRTDKVVNVEDIQRFYFYSSDPCS